MKEIHLTQNQVALVDDEDYDWLMQWKWFAHWMPKVHGYYAGRNSPRVNGKQTTILMHRLILGLPHGDKRQGDHLDHNTLNNCRANLAIVTHQQNQWNRKSSKGYSWNTHVHAYVAKIKTNGNNKYLGMFDSPDAAHSAYLEAKSIYHVII